MIQYSYDNNGNLLTVTDPLFRVTTNQYDVLDRLTRTYDDAGNGATRTDARGITTTYTYDALDRVSAATVTDGTVSYEYDNLTTGGSYAKGRLTKVTDPSGNTTYVYDSLGRVTSKTQSVTASPSAKSFTVSYSYSSGRRTGLTYPSGRVVAYGFDAQGQVTSITVDGATTVLSAAEYFPFGAARKWSWGNAQVYERTFDLDGRIKTLSLGPATAIYADLRSARAGPR